jgi:hypothetical protein
MLVLVAVKALLDFGLLAKMIAKKNNIKDNEFPIMMIQIHKG